MSKSYEFTAKTSEEAIEAGLQELGLAITDVDVVVLEEGSKGLFGLFGSRPAKIRMTVKEEADDLMADLFSEKENAEETAPKPVEKKQEHKPEKKADPKPEEAPQASAKPAPVQRTPKAPKQKKQPEAQKQPKAAEEPKPLPPKNPPVKPLEKPEVTFVPAEEIPADSNMAKAKEFILELTRLMGVQVDVAMGQDAEGNLYANLTGDSQGVLIGRRGETLDAVQYLTSLCINRDQENYTRITIDTENYRARREDTLIRLANRKANQVVRTGRKVRLEPMNPYERRIIHSALQPNEQVDTHSEGEDPNRCVVITLRK